MSFAPSSSKYTRSKVRKAMPEEFAYIIDELLHMQIDEENNQIEYHRQIIETIIHIQTADEFIISLAELIKRLAVDHLHIVGDIYDRGAHPDKIIVLLMEYQMNNRKLLEKINKATDTVVIGDKTYVMKRKYFPTSDICYPYELTTEEAAVLSEL